MRQVFWYTPLFIIWLCSGKVTRLSFRRLSVASGPLWMRRKPYISGWQSLLWWVRYNPQKAMEHAFRQARRM